MSSIIFFIFLIFFSLPSDLVHCQSNDTVAYWSGKTLDGYSNYFVIVGNPAVYLENFAKKNFETNNSFVLLQWNALTKKTAFPSIAYDFGRDLVAISQNNPRSINLDQLSFALAKTGAYKDILDDLPLSDSITGLAFATNFNLLYWVDALFQYIGVLELTKYQWTKIVDTNLIQPLSIALHEARGFVFWSDVGLKPRIERSNLIGEERIVIVDSFLTHATHLVIEKKMERLFWIDRDLKSSDFFGNDIVTYKTSGDNANTLTSFVLYRDFVIFGSEEGPFLCYKMPENSSDELEYLTTYVIMNTVKVMSGSLDSKELMMIVPNPCDTNPPCDHLCIPRNLTKSICFCSFGFHLNPDGRTCSTGKIKVGQLLVSDVKQGMLFQVDPVSGYVEAILKIYPDYVENMACLAVANESYIYHTRKTGIVIWRYQISNGVTSVFYRADNLITDIAADPSSGFVYFSTRSGEIHEAKSATSVRVIVSKENEIIEKLFLDSEARRLFYSECGSNSLVEVDLNNRQEIKRLTVGVCATSMVFDLQEGNVCIGNRNNRSLLIYNINEQMTHQLVTMSGNISDLTMYEERLYVVESSNTVMKVNKHSTVTTTLTQPVFASAKEILFVTYKIAGKQHSPSTLPVIIGPIVAGVVAVVIVVVVVVVIKSLNRKEISRFDSQIYDEISESYKNSSYDMVGSYPIYIDPIFPEDETESPTQ